MVKAHVILLSILLTGCSAFKVEPPVSDICSAFTPGELVNIKPAAIPKLPSGADTVLNQDQINQIVSVREAALANTEVLDNIILALNASINESNAKTELCKMSEAQYNYLGKRWADSEEARAKEELFNLIETSILKIILLGIIL